MTGGADQRLFTGRFLVMCGFTFTVFLSVFMLLPTMPYRILALGGRPWQAGMFLGLLTYASAFSAPLTGALADRLGRRRVLVSSSLVIGAFSVAYALSPAYWLPLALALVHGVFWSALLSASSAHLTDLVPPHRRAEGIGWWGSTSIIAIAVAPPLGFRLYAHGWGTLCAAVALLNLGQAAIAWRLRGARPPARAVSTGLVEWRVLGVSGTLFLYTLGYGGITSFVALFTDSLRVAPRSLFFIVYSVVVLLTRPLSGPLGDRVGHRRLILPSLVLIAAGLALLAAARDGTGLSLAAAVFGLGYGTTYPAFTAHVVHRTDPARRGATFGSMLAAFDTGVGTGSIAAGWAAERFGYPAAFGAAALLASLALPWFLLTDRRLLGR